MGAVFLCALLQAREVTGWAIAFASGIFLPAVFRSSRRFARVMVDAIRLSHEQRVMNEALLAARDQALEASGCLHGPAGSAARAWVSASPSAWWT